MNIYTLDFTRPPISPEIWDIPSKYRGANLNFFAARNISNKPITIIRFTKWRPSSDRTGAGNCNSAHWNFSDLLSQARVEIYPPNIPCFGLSSGVRSFSFETIEASQSEWLNPSPPNWKGGVFALIALHLSRSLFKVSYRLPYIPFPVWTTFAADLY